MIDSKKDKTSQDDFDEDFEEFSDLDEESLEDSSYDEDDLAYIEDAESDLDSDDWDLDQGDNKAEHEGGLPVLPSRGEEAPAKKSAQRSGKSSGRSGSPLSFNTIIILGAVLIGGGVFAYSALKPPADSAQGPQENFRSSLNMGWIMDGRLGGGEDQKEEKTAPSAQEQGNAGGVAPSNSSGVPESQEESEGFLNNPEAFQETVSSSEEQDLIVQQSPPQPSPISPTENQPLLEEDIFSPVEQDAAAPDPAVAPVTTPSGTAGLPVVVSSPVAPSLTIEQPDSAQSPATPTLTEGEQEPVSVPTAGSGLLQEENQLLRQKTLELSEKTVALEEELAKMKAVHEAQLAQLQSDLKKAKDSLAEKQKAEKALQEKLKKAEKNAKVAAEEKKQAPPVSAAVSASPSVPAAQKPAVSSAPSSPRDSVYSPVGARPPVSSATETIVWDIRAAQPGKAWISRRGERDMRGIVVGDSVPGLGQITSIAYQNGRWVVQGTQGAAVQ